MKQLVLSKRPGVGRGKISPAFPELELGGDGRVGWGGGAHGLVLL